ncbi:peptidoglycan recognition protein family protein [Faecalimonas sp.]
MSVKVRELLVSGDKYNIKCPYQMVANTVTVHNTWNDAPAENEVKYMIGNSNKVSFHYAVDDKEVVQGIPEDRNAFHAGDGVNGKGNRESIAVEICYSKSGGDRFTKAEKNAAEFIASILKRKGWGIEKVKKHQDWSGKYCPHRTLDLGWERFLNLIRGYLGNPSTPSKPSSSYNGVSLVDYLKSIGKDSSFAARKKYAAQYGIKNYEGTSAQNTALLNEMRGNTKPSAPKPSVSYYKVVNKNGLVPSLKEIGVDSSFTHRKAIAKANGIANYTGTFAQNDKLATLLAKGKLKKA